MYCKLHRLPIWANYWKLLNCPLIGNMMLHMLHWILILVLTLFELHWSILDNTAIVIGLLLGFGLHIWPVDQDCCANCMGIHISSHYLRCYERHVQDSIVLVTATEVCTGRNNLARPGPARSLFSPASFQQLIFRPGALHRPTRLSPFPI